LEKPAYLAETIRFEFIDLFFLSGELSFMSKFKGLLKENLN
jgi:hypothetical protein